MKSRRATLWLVSLFAALPLVPLGCGTAGRDSHFDTDPTEPEGGSPSSSGAAVSSGFGTSGDPGGGPGSMSSSGTSSSGGLVNDAAPATDASACTQGDAGPGPVHRQCAPPTDNECDNAHDFPGAPPNGATGNGFDDDCDGLVDEGCACTAAGTTKDCWLVPSSQTQGGAAVGWCAQNAKGSMDCVRSGEFGPYWSGQCRGAQPPYAEDVCAPGDFDCDGADANPHSRSCACAPKGGVVCPTMPLTTAPYPPTRALPLQVSAGSWFVNPSDETAATGWKWTIRGGDCDNILPHPTFAMYRTNDGTAATLGTQVDTLGVSGKERGFVAQAPAVSSSFYPAFATSGDYVVQGEFDLYGTHYACTQKVQVRAPGLRAELCWDTTGNTDIDLHMAKVDGFPTCQTAGKMGWSDNCSREDCYYGNCASSGFGVQPAWFGASPTSACIGWGSFASGTTCQNPRLDRDNISCTRSVTNPNDRSFCGSENINVDNPSDGSQYAIGVRYFNGSSSTKPHVNLYCNGERVLSTGYDPISGNDWPKLLTPGQGTSGDMWKVALVNAHLTGGVLSCDVAPTGSLAPHPTTDNSTSYCVDNTSNDTANSAKLLTPGGGVPATAQKLCFH